MSRFGFCGPTYESESVIADAQRCVNFYPEVLENASSKSSVALYPTEGLKVFSTPNKKAKTAVTAIEVNRKGPLKGNIVSVEAAIPPITKTAGAGDDLGGGSVAWTTPDNVASSVGFALASGVGGVYSNVLRAKQFGFTLPSLTQIQGVKLELEAFGSSTHDASPQTIRPKTYQNGGTHPGDFEGGVDQGHSWITSTGVGYSNPDSAVDGDEATYADISLQHTHQYALCVWKFDPYLPPSTPTAVSLQILSAVTASILTLRDASVWLTKDGGNSWTKVYSSTSKAQSWDTVQLPANQDISQVQVMAFTDAHDDMGQRVYDIKVVYSFDQTPPAAPTLSVQLTSGGVLQGTSQTQSLTGSSTTLTFGGKSDLWGTGGISAALANATDAGVVIVAHGPAGSTAAVSVQNVRITIYFTPLIEVTLDAACPYKVGQQVIFDGLTTATFLNLAILTVIGVGGNSFSAAWTGEAYASASDTGNSYNLIPSQVIATLASNPFSVGEKVTFVDVVTADWLNGQTVFITHVDGNQIFAAWDRQDYGPANDTGNVIPGPVEGLPVARAVYSVNNQRCFAISGDTFYEVFSNGTFTNKGTVANDNKPACMVSSATELMMCAGGKLYVYDLDGNVFAAVPKYSDGVTVIPNVWKVEYCDGYFVALLDDSQKIIISKLLDGTTWDAADIAQVSVFSEKLVSMIVDHREIWLFGYKRTAVYYNSGNTFPFDVNPSGFIDQGCAAINSPVRLDNSIMWIGADERGAGVAWRAQGYSPVRISNHAVEQAWSKYSTITDAVAYGYQNHGHAFYVIYFPSADKTWVYDAATGMWHERSFRENGNDRAHRSQCHAYCFGKHIVGDPRSGNLYDMSFRYVDDFSHPIRRMRRAPHICTEQQWMYHHQLQLDMEVGVGPIPPMQQSDGSARDPQIMLRWSDNGGKTWSNEHWTSAGQAGEYETRAIWRRLGRARDRVYEVVVSDPVSWRIVDAYLNASPGYSPQERMSSNMRKMA